MVKIMMFEHKSLLIRICMVLVMRKSIMGWRHHELPHRVIPTLATPLQRYMHFEQQLCQYTMCRITGRYATQSRFYKVLYKKIVHMSNQHYIVTVLSQIVHLHVFLFDYVPHVHQVRSEIEFGGEAVRLIKKTIRAIHLQ